MKLPLIATLLCCSGLAFAEAKVEDITLKDGRMLTGVYDEVAGTITLSGKIKAVIEVKADDIADRKPAKAKPVEAAPPAGEGDKGEKGEKAEKPKKGTLSTINARIAELNARIADGNARIAEAKKRIDSDQKEIDDLTQQSEGLRYAYELNLLRTLNLDDYKWEYDPKKSSPDNENLRMDAQRYNEAVRSVREVRDRLAKVKNPEPKTDPIPTALRDAVFRDLHKKLKGTNFKLATEQ